MNQTESEHYTYSFVVDSLAEREFDFVRTTQENCYQQITSILNHHFAQKICYHIYESSKDVGKQYLNLRGESIDSETEMNAFAWYPNSVYCTYNSKTKAIGCHEDAHLILYNYFSDLGLIFLNEGFSVYMDNYWLGTRTDIWTKYLKTKKHINNSTDLFDDDGFYGTHNLISYPIAGSFCGWIISTYGIEFFKELYRKSIKTNIKDELIDMSKSFEGYITKIEISDTNEVNMRRRLNEYGISEIS